MFIVGIDEWATVAFVGLLNKEQKSIKQSILKIARALFA